MERRILKVILRASADYDQQLKICLFNHYCYSFYLIQRPLIFTIRVLNFTRIFTIGSVPVTEQSLAVPVGSDTAEEQVI